MTTAKISHYAADNYRLYRSALLIAPDDDTYMLIKIPKYGFVKGVWLEVETAYVAGSPLASVGWMGNGETAQEAGFISTTVAKVTEVGFKAATKDTLTNFAAKYFDSADGFITLTIAAGGATTEGNLRVWAEFTIIH